MMNLRVSLLSGGKQILLQVSDNIISFTPGDSPQLSDVALLAGRWPET
jgi:hypothetical protein